MPQKNTSCSSKLWHHSGSFTRTFGRGKVFPTLLSLDDPPLCSLSRHGHTLHRSWGCEERDTPCHRMEACQRHPPCAQASHFVRSEPSRMLTRPRAVQCRGVRESLRRLPHVIRTCARLELGAGARRVSSAHWCVRAPAPRAKPGVRPPQRGHAESTARIRSAPCDPTAATQSEPPN